VAECLNAKSVYMCGIIGTVLISLLMSAKKPIDFIKCFNLVKDFIEIRV
jgi:hypothetical protein